MDLPACYTPLWVSLPDKPVDDRLVNSCLVSRYRYIYYMPLWAHMDLWEVFNFLNMKGDCVVRILLENHFLEKSNKELDECFIDYVNLLLCLYLDIIFTGGEKKRDWTTLVSLPYIDAYDCYEFFEGDNLKIPFPKKWAKRNNPIYWELIDNSMYWLFDFIEIK